MWHKTESWLWASPPHVQRPNTICFILIRTFLGGITLLVDAKHSRANAARVPLKHHQTRAFSLCMHRPQLIDANDPPTRYCAAAARAALKNRQIKIFFVMHAQPSNCRWKAIGGAPRGSFWACISGLGLSSAVRRREQTETNSIGRAYDSGYSNGSFSDDQLEMVERSRKPHQISGSSMSRQKADWWRV